MFSLFRKDVSSSQQSLHELTARNQLSVDDAHRVEPDTGAAGNSERTGADRLMDDSYSAASTEPECSDPCQVNGPVASGCEQLTDASIDEQLDAARGFEPSVDDDPNHPETPLESSAPSSEESLHADDSWFDDLPEPVRTGKVKRSRGKRLVRPTAGEEKPRTLTPQQRLLLLDSWRRSGLPAGDFASLVGISKHTLYKWNEQFKRLGPEGLMDQPRGSRKERRLSELTKRTILMLKENHPEWGCQRISDMLVRGPALAASPSTVARVLHEAGYEMVQEPTRSHPDKVRRFERAKPNQLWQTDLFTFMLKRQNRRVYLVAFMDDHSRFITSYGLHASASTALVLEALEAGISGYGPPEEVLTDNGPQYVTWRGKSQFTRRLEQRGIRQIVARPRRPQTLGKIERFWGSLWRECLETAVFVDLAEARARIGLFIDYYNFQRVHRGVGGLVPADRFFHAAADVARTLKERVAANSLELARHGEPRTPFYVTGQLDGQSFSVHAEGPRLILTRAGQSRQEVEFTAPPTPAAGEPMAPSTPPSIVTEGTAPAMLESGPATSRPLPVPVCPDGSPGTDAPEDEQEVQDGAQPGGDA